MAEIHGITIAGQRYLLEPLLYAVCNNNATENKAINIPYFELTQGVTIHVLFVNTNEREEPTLNINNGATVPIYLDGTTPVGTTPATSWLDNSVVTLTFTGNKWITAPIGSSLFKIKQEIVNSPTANNDALAFIDTISQDVEGIITATKKNVQIVQDVKKKGLIRM